MTTTNIIYVVRPIFINVITGCEFGNGYTARKYEFPPHFPPFCVENKNEQQENICADSWEIQKFEM